ncbi:MAG: ABC transporter substrate-binding protein [Gammaproteobacteria bacterium]
MRHSLSLLFIVTTIIFSGSSYAEKEKIRIGWVYAMANAPVIIADKKGYFEEMGLDAEIRSFTSGPIVHQALAAGELDMAYIGSPPVYHWFSRGLDSRILAKVNYGQAAVMVRKDSGITDLQGLKGKKLAGVKKGSGMDVLLRGYVLGVAAHMEPDKDVSIVPMPSGNMGPSVEAKVVDGAFIWEPFTSQFELRGDSKVIFDMNEAVPKYPWYVVMAMPDALKNKRSAIKKVLAAHKKAVDFLNSSPDAGNDIIAAAFKLEDVKNETTGQTITGTQVVAQARKRLGWEWDLTEKDMSFIQNLMDFSLSLGYISKPLKANELVDKSFINEVALHQ